MKNQKNITNYLVLGILVVLVVGTIIYLESVKPKNSESGKKEDSSGFMLKDSKYPKAPELKNIAGYINYNDNLTIASLQGKVVIVDFWTYSCINCIRTLPYLAAWDQKYRENGLVIIGVHTPEFAFEKDINNVRMAVKKYGIEYPVVLDNDYDTWKNYKNNYWPRKYLIDKDGFIRYDHIGEGGYQETEKQIQELLKELGSTVNATSVRMADNTPTTTNTNEIYLGYSNALPRGQNIGGVGFKPDELFLYKKPLQMDEDVVYLEGDWISRSEYLESSNGSIIYLKFTAKNANIVLEGKGNVDVFIDNLKIPEKVSGTDVINGRIRVNESRLYDIFDVDYGTYTLKLVFDKGIKAHAFTFG